MTSRDERTACDEFAVRYAIPATDINAAIERQVIGAVWGANGYTTVDQADELADRLDLRAGRRVLDVGTGRGWPGLYYAVRYACTVAGTDMPVDALVAASRRARAERAEHRFTPIAASGSSQPFRQGSFDAIVHTDVLC
jgi:methylase of polypeptide subunit release factors